MSWKKIVAAAIAPMAFLVVAGTASSASAQSVSAPVTTETSAPRMITGYTPHGGAAMADQNIAESEVDAVVLGAWLSATYDEERATWRYTGGGDFPSVVVILNDGGQVVTAWRM